MAPSGGEIDLYGEFKLYDISIPSLISTEILGVQRDASSAEIKKAYHKVRAHFAISSIPAFPVDCSKRC